MARMGLFGMFGGLGSVGREGSGSDNGSLNLEMTSSTTPQFLISSDNPDLFSSEIENFPSYAPIIKFRNASSRNITIDASAHFTTDGRIITETPLVFMKSGEWTAPLQNHLYEGIVIDMITIVRTGTVNSKIEVLQSIDYTDCYISKFEQIGDEIAFAFSFHAVDDTTTHIQSNGIKKGKLGYSFRIYGDTGEETVGRGR